MAQSFTRHRVLTILLVLMLIPLGMYSKYYRGWAGDFVNYSLGGVIYVLFFSLLCSLFLSKTDPRVICAGVVLVTCLLECLQVWHPPALELLRSGIIGSTLLGTTFAWSDFLYYFLGGGIAWFWLGRSSNNGSKRR